jgi:Glycosyl transferase family 2
VLLERQLASIASQSYGDFRCLIGFDGPDEKASLARDLVRGDDRFTVREYDQNVGVYRHFERLLADVPRDAPWVALSDQDDRWYAEKLSRLLPELGRPGTTAVSGQARVVDVGGAVLRASTCRHQSDLIGLLWQNEVTGALTVFDTGLLEQALPFPDSDSSAAMHDHWLAVVAAATGRVLILPDVVQDYVQHGRNVLGEPQPTSLVAWASDLGSLRTRANQRGSWRLTMAQALAQRRLAEIAVPGSGRRGTWLTTLDTVRTAHDDGRMRLRGALAALLDAGLFAARRRSR